MWEVAAYLGFAAVAGALISSISALVWGPGATRSLGRRLKIAENRIEDVDDRITSEVKKRANVASRESRNANRTDAELTTEALSTLGDPYAAPEVGTGRVRPGGVFPAPRGNGR